MCLLPMSLLCCQKVSQPDAMVCVCVCEYGYAWVCVTAFCATRTISRRTGLQLRQERRLDRRRGRFSTESQPWIRNRGKGTDWGFRVERSVCQSGKHSDTETRKKRSPAWHWSWGPADCDWVTGSVAEDGRAVITPRQLALWNRICFSPPQRDSLELAAITLSEPCSGPLQRGIKDVCLVLVLPDSQVGFTGNLFSEVAPKCLHFKPRSQSEGQNFKRRMMEPGGPGGPFKLAGTLELWKRVWEHDKSE